MIRFVLILSVFFGVQGAVSFAQDVDFENSWKLVKVEKNGVTQSFNLECVLLIDPNRLVACYNPYSNELDINGTWKRKKNTSLKIMRDGFTVEYFIHSWTADQLIISRSDMPEEKLYLEK